MYPGLQVAHLELSVAIEVHVAQLGLAVLHATHVVPAVLLVKSDLHVLHVIAVVHSAQPAEQGMQTGFAASVMSL